MLAPDWFSGFDKLFGCQWTGYRVILHTGQGQLVLTPVDCSCHAVAVLYSGIIFMCPFTAY